MEARRIYRGIEEAAETGRFRDAGFRHSSLSRALRYNYRELRDMSRFNAVSLLSLSALYGNPATRLDEGNKSRNNLLDAIRSSIPYLSSLASGDRDYAVEVYRRMMEKLGEGMDGH